MPAFTRLASGLRIADTSEDVTTQWLDKTDALIERVQSLQTPEG
jgi:hypothetical protein